MYHDLALGTFYSISVILSFIDFQKFGGLTKTWQKSIKVILKSFVKNILKIRYLRAAADQLFFSTKQKNKSNL